MDSEKRKAVYIKGGRGWTDLATHCLSCDSVTTVAYNVQTSINSQHVLLPAYSILYCTATTRNQKRGATSHTECIV